MDLRTVHTVPAFSLVYTRKEIPWNFRILRIHEKNERESVETALNRVDRVKRSAPNAGLFIPIFDSWNAIGPPSAISS